MAFPLLVRNLYTESVAWFRHHHNMAMGYRTSVYHVVALGTGDGGSRPTKTLRWRHNGRDSVSNHQPHDCLLNLLFWRRSKKTSKLRVTGLCAWNSPGTGEFPAQIASYAVNVSIWWRHHEYKAPSQYKDSLSTYRDFNYKDKRVVSL